MAPIRCPGETMSAVRHIPKLFCLLALVLCVACNNKNSGDAAEKDSTQATTATKPAETSGKADPGAEKIKEDIYPDFQLSMFSDEEKVKLIKVNKAELCPCPDANNSLHECLQSREQRCDLAAQAVSLIANMVKASYNETDILDQVAQLIDNAKRQHAFKLEDRPLKGSADAKVIIVEFADFQCPHCKEASKMMKALTAKHGDKIGIYYKQFPLSAHEHGELAARASIAAHKQGKFWPMHDELFKNQKSLSYTKIVSIGQRIGLNMGKFKVDIESPDVREVIAEDRKDGDAAGLTGTPTIFINGRRLLGEMSEEGLQAAVADALRDAEKTATTDDKK
jgi:protein-disulfide isomerase